MKLQASRVSVALAAGAIAVGGVSLASAAPTATPRPWQNCGQVNAKWPRGIGNVGAHDSVRGNTEPVTTFKRSNTLYRKAMSYNKRLDADKDGIACEKR
jgi:Excalibur calcium-binding domain